MIRKALLLRIFDAAYMQRWNDRLRPVDFIELDKQAHKMVTAYFLGKFESDGKGFSWVDIIEGGIFELLQRLVITDLKPPIFYEIKKDASQYQRLNDWVFRELEPLISPVSQGFHERFKTYFTGSEENINKRILAAAHFYASSWEFEILKRADPAGYEVEAIARDLETESEKYYDLKGQVPHPSGHGSATPSQSPPPV